VFIATDREVYLLEMVALNNRRT